MWSKLEWQRRRRKEFRELNGFSAAAHYATGGLRKQVLERDLYMCVACGMTDMAHKEKWGRPITVDHKDRNRSNNVLGNLQTLCLRCHGQKDILPRLKARQVEKHREEIISRRLKGETYQSIADSFGFSIASVWKWLKIWNYGSETKKSG